MDKPKGLLSACIFIWFLTFFSCGMGHVITEISPLENNRVIKIRTVYTNPSPYKKLITTNLKTAVYLTHKTNSRLKKRISAEFGFHEIESPLSIFDQSIDSFNLEISIFKKSNPGEMYSPITPYIINDIEELFGKELSIPDFLNYPCCLDGNLELKKAWIETSHGPALGDCPCRDY